MITQAISVVAATFLAFAAAAPSLPPDTRALHSTAVVKRVVDGDTIELEGGRRVRLLGIDTPERGEPMAREATRRLEKLIGPGAVELLSCRETDRYGRLLSIVRAGEVNVNLALLHEGLALPLLIPPCGSSVAEEILQNATLAAKAGKGLYSGDVIRVVSHLDAEDHIGNRVMVRGTVLTLYKGPKAWHLNFGDDYRADFTAVLFEEGRSRFRDLGIDPDSLVGAEVLVIGHVKRYNGPEIILRGPDQILVLKDKANQKPNEFRRLP